MAARPGLRTGIAWLGRGVPVCAWLIAASVTGALVDMPIAVPGRGTTPRDAVAVPIPGSHDPPPPPKKQEKLIELAPWEEVPT